MEGEVTETAENEALQVDYPVEITWDEPIQPAFDSEEDIIKDAATILGCTENEILQLCAIFHKEAHELPDIFSELGWGADQVLKLDRTLSPVFLAVKLKLDNGSSIGACVAMCLIFDVSKSSVMEELYWVTHGKFPDWFSVNEVWEKFRVDINQIGGNFESVLFKMVRTDFKSVFTIETLRKLATADTLELRDNICERIIESCVPSVFPQKPVFEIDVERFSASRLTLGGIKAEIEEEEQVFIDFTSEEGKEEVCIVCSPVIDPVKGKVASELKKGDFIRVELNDGPGIAGVVYYLLNKIKLDTMFPVISAEVSETGTATVKFLINNEITGITRVPGEVRLKAYENRVNIKTTFLAKLIPLFFIASLLSMLVIVLYYLIR